MLAEASPNDLKQVLKAYRHKVEARKATKFGAERHSPSEARASREAFAGERASEQRQNLRSSPFSESEGLRSPAHNLLIVTQTEPKVMGAVCNTMLWPTCFSILATGSASSSSKILQYTEKMPFYNPEHSCPAKREVDWPLLKMELRYYADQPTWQRRDVDRRFEEFSAAALAEVFEAHYVQYTTRIPFLLTILSGWPLFRIYSGLVDSVQIGDVFSAIRLLQGAEGLSSDDGKHVLTILARILTNAEAAAAQMSETSGRAEPVLQAADCAFSCISQNCSTMKMYPDDSKCDFIKTQ
eukprot:s157_g19.t2